MHTYTYLRRDWRMLKRMYKKPNHCTTMIMMMIIIIHSPFSPFFSEYVYIYLTLCLSKKNKNKRKRNGVEKKGGKKGGR